MSEASAFERAILAHDRTIAGLGLEIWVGNEPTFTDRRLHTPEWTTAALGDDKLERAGRLIAELVASAPPGCAILRSIGRRYAGEAACRWSLGLYQRRDGAAVWDGP